MPKVPDKIDRLLARVRIYVETGAYFDSAHSSARQLEREIARGEIRYVLLTGWHEPERDRYNNLYDTWNYAIRGRTVDGKNIRVVFAILEERLIVITVIQL